MGCSGCGRRRAKFQKLVQEKKADLTKVVKPDVVKPDARKLRIEARNERMRIRNERILKKRSQQSQDVGGNAKQ